MNQPPPYQPPPYQPPPYQPPMQYQPTPNQSAPGYSQPYVPGAFGMPPGQAMYSHKSKVAAGLLQIFFSFGIGRFYAGHIGLGVAQLVVCLIGVPLLPVFGIGGFAFLWTFIDGIYLLASQSRDGNGLLLR